MMLKNPLLKSKNTHNLDISFSNKLSKTEYRKSNNHFVFLFIKSTVELGVGRAKNASLLKSYF
jgi:hypothetical protein